MIGAYGWDLIPVLFSFVGIALGVLGFWNTPRRKSPVPGVVQMAVGVVLLLAAGSFALGRYSAACVWA